MRVVQLFLVALVAMPVSVNAEIFTWKDENGKTHFGDKVPEKYKDNNSEVEIGAVNSADPEKTRKTKGPGWFTRKPEGKSKPAQSATEKPAAKAPKTCAEKKAAYARSEACFEQCRLYTYDQYGNRRPSGMNSVCAAQNGCQNMKKPDC